MLIGITYDLKNEYLAQGYTKEQVAELDDLDTIEAIDKALIYHGHVTDRIGNVRSLVSRLSRGGRWDLVFNIAEGLHGHGREATIPAILDEYCIPYTFSNPLTLCACLNKVATGTILKGSNVPAPKHGDGDNLPVFMKPAAEGSSKGIHGESIIKSIGMWNSYLIENDAICVEEYLPGREFTVGLMGSGSRSRVIGIMEIELRNGHEIYSYEAKQDYRNSVAYKLIDDKISRDSMGIALKAYKVMDCRDAARIDLKCDKDGNPKVIDVNPLPGLNPEHSDLCILARLKGISYTDLIGQILDSAMERIN